MTIYSIYKENRPIVPKQVINVADLGYLSVEKDFPEQLSSLLIKKGKSRVVKRRKRVQQNPFQQKEDSDRACHHMSSEKVQDYE